MFVLLASLVLGACSSDSDDNDSTGTSQEAAYTETTVSEAPQWQIDWNNDQQKPDWKEPDASAYANWTILMVQIEEALQPYVSKDDLMAIFVNGELVYKKPSLEKIRRYVQSQLKHTVWAEEQRFENPHLHYTDLSLKLYDLKSALLAENKTKENK